VEAIPRLPFLLRIFFCLVCSAETSGDPLIEHKMADVDPLSDLDSGDSPLSPPASPPVVETPSPELEPSSEPEIDADMDVDADAEGDENGDSSVQISAHRVEQQQDHDFGDEGKTTPEHELSYSSLLARRLASLKAGTVESRRAAEDAPPPKGYTISPLLSLPHSTQVNALALPPCSSHILSGGQDGFIRRFGLHSSLATTLGLGELYIYFLSGVLRVCVLMIACFGGGEIFKANCIRLTRGKRTTT
jgi:hypothetical protein